MGKKVFIKKVSRKMVNLWSKNLKKLKKKNIFKKVKPNFLFVDIYNEDLKK